MTSGVRRLLAVWVLVLGGLAFLIGYVPKPGMKGAPPSAPLPPAPPLESGGAEEAYAQALMACDRGRLEEALAGLERALARDPGFAPAWAQKAFVLARTEGADPALVRELLGKARSLGFERDRCVRNLDRLVAGDPAHPGAGRFHLEKAVILGFTEPVDPAGARAALALAEAVGVRASPAVVAALAQVPPPPGR